MNDAKSRMRSSMNSNDWPCFLTLKFIKKVSSHLYAE